MRFIGSGARRTNTSGIGLRIDLLDAAGDFLLRRDLGVARGYGGQAPLIAHFGGVDPTTSYILRVHLRRGPVDVPVTPADAASAFAGGRTVEGLLTIREDEIDQSVRVIRWQEVSAAEGD